jgi:hypothetical protein
MRILNFFVVGFIFIFLTVLTQVGGIIYLLTFGLYPLIHRKIKTRTAQYSIKLLSFLILYSFTTFLILPHLSKPLGRVPLPLTGQLRPLTFLTCFLNRHYVRPELKQIALNASEEMQTKFPGTTLNYLDANFPFIDKFPLIPHLSHNDGKKLDLAFYYKDSKTGNISNNNPSIIGYGVCEEPKAGEEDKPEFCAKKGYWQYSFLTKIIPQGNKKDYTFDAERTKALIVLLVRKNNVGKIFLEPHLKTRMNLTSGKIRFHGCQAVRHDDHIHLQLK